MRRKRDDADENVRAILAALFDIKLLLVEIRDLLKDDDEEEAQEADSDS